MKDEKQIIEEMAKDVAHSISWCDEVIPEVDCLATAEALYGMGYCKQSKGEWVFNRGRAHGEPAYYCSLCNEGASEYGMDNFCPKCGAKMKGGG